MKAWSACSGSVARYVRVGLVTVTWLCDFFIGFVTYVLLSRIRVQPYPFRSCVVAQTKLHGKRFKVNRVIMSATTCSSCFVCLSTSFMVRCRCHCFVLEALSCLTFVYRQAPSWPSFLHAQKQSSSSRDLLKITPDLICVNLAASIMLFSCRGGTPVHSTI